MKGFTLIELLVVIAVLGVLAAGIFTAINPLERLAQARDSQRKSAAGQIVQAIQAYYVTHTGTYPPNVNGNWIQTLVDSGDLKTVPSSVSYGSGNYACGDPAAGRSAWTMQNNYCYVTFPDGSAVMHVSLESQSAKSKCTDSAKPYPYFAWSSSQSQVCLACSASGDGPGSCVN